MARSILSFGMFSARAAKTAARSRAFMDGSGRPNFAATVISRASFEKSLARIASCLPFLCMMFLNWLCPAIAVFYLQFGPAAPLRSGALTYPPHGAGWFGQGKRAEADISRCFQEIK